MAFMLQRKKYYRFQVDICVEELTAVPFINAVLFAKLRLLNGGNFSETSGRKEVHDHVVHWAAKFNFECKMTANASTGVLNPCTLRISVRREVKGGYSFQKLGFCNVNLAEFAGSGETARRYLLEGYDSHQRQDNSVLTVSIRMNLLSGDILFKVPSPSTKHISVSKQGEDSVDSCDRVSAFSSTHTSKVSSSISENACLPGKRQWISQCDSVLNAELTIKEVSKKIEIVTVNDNHEECLSGVHSSQLIGSPHNNSGMLSVIGHGHNRWHSSPKIYRHVRNASTGFCFNDTSVPVETSSLDRRKKSEHGIIRDSNSGSAIDADSIIDELIRSTIQNQVIESDENLGLQLFIAKDGSTTLGTPKGSSQLSSGCLKEVVVKSNQS